MSRLRHLLIRLTGIACLTTALGGCAQIGGQPSAPDTALVDALRRGINLGHWFTHRSTTDDAAAQPLIGPDDFALIRQLGLGHVRIGVDPDWLTSSPSALAELMSALDAVRAAGLAVVVVMQPEEAYKRAVFADSGARARLMSTWTRLAEPLARWPTSTVAFEALNEPEHGDPVAVRHLMAEIVTTLRRVAPRHTVIVSPGGYADIEDLVGFAPLDTDNLIYTFHFYEPKNFTHQGAYWGWPMWVSFFGFPYPSSPEAVAPQLAHVAPGVRSHLAHYGEERWNRERLAAALDRAAAWAQRHGVPLWCGEFGVFRHNAEAAHRHAWLKDVTELMQARNMGWALWDYTGPFGITQGLRHERTLDADMATALGLRPPAP